MMDLLATTAIGERGWPLEYILVLLGVAIGGIHPTRLSSDEELSLSDILPPSNFTPRCNSSLECTDLITIYGGVVEGRPALGPECDGFICRTTEATPEA